MELSWTDLAISSLNEIHAYIEENFSENIARKSLSGIIKNVSKLAFSPFMGRPLEGCEDLENVRCYNYRQNKIVYQVFEDEILVLIVWDGRRNSDMMLDLVLDYFGFLNAEQ